MILDNQDWPCVINEGPIRWRQESQAGWVVMVGARGWSDAKKGL